MRRLLLLALLVPTFGWLFWAACQSDDYRDTLPLRSFDAAPREAGATNLPDLSTVRPDLGGPGDLGRPDQGLADLPPAGDGGAVDAGGNDGGSDGGSGDGGAADGGSGDAGGTD